MKERIEKRINALEQSKQALLTQLNMHDVALAELRGLLMEPVEVERPETDADREKRKEDEDYTLAAADLGERST